MAVIKFEDLKRLLQTAPEVTNLKNGGEELFNREFEFDVRDNHYKIVWYTNISYLYINEMSVLFYQAEINTTWPTDYRNFLIFKDNEGDVIAVIPLEKYDKRK